MLSSVVLGELVAVTSSAAASAPTAAGPIT
jgi:hypothetical protein